MNQQPNQADSAEEQRLRKSAARSENWQRWGPYLSERQWGTVREDYSATGECWDYFPHDHARSRAYRWGEDGLLGITDRECRLCFALALWNGKDPILKERLFGLTGPQGNHGEDVKECYYYLDSSPTHSYMKALYKYPQAEYPYARLVEENARRGKQDPEFELTDTEIFDGDRYYDVLAEYAKASPNDILIRITIANRGPESASLHVLPTLWFRNTWVWGSEYDRSALKPALRRTDDLTIQASHSTLGEFRLRLDPSHEGERPALFFTKNETNHYRLFGTGSPGGYTKDAFHRCVIDGEIDAINHQGAGTKAAAHYTITVPSRESTTIRLRLHSDQETPDECFGTSFDRVFTDRIRETDKFYEDKQPAEMGDDANRVWRQAYSGLLWSKQFYHYVVKDWLQGDSAQPAPSAARQRGRNHDWPHLYNRDVISMPDKWEYPWYAAWDLAFHTIPLARIDPEFAKSQLVLLLREWYMHANGQIPAYEFAFSDVNPPVHAWACWRVYKMTGPRGGRDRRFLTRVFHKLMLNFTWWVNRKDVNGQHLFSGGFLGLDNIGVFDRSKPLPTGGHLEQADGTAWMAFYCGTMLSMALELAEEDSAYGDMASKFFEHYVAIVDAMNTQGGSGLWDDDDGFYYDRLATDGTSVPLRTRSLVGLVPVFAVEVLEDHILQKLPGFRKRMEWFLEHRRDLGRHVSYMEYTCPHGRQHGHRLLAVPSRERLERVLRYVLDENEFLSPYGLRSLSKFHHDHPYVFRVGNAEHRVDYVPGESNTGLFGGNSNWRGPVWLPLNYLMIEALERYHHFYGDTFQVEFPTGSGRSMNLLQVAHELCHRLGLLFLVDQSGKRPCHGEVDRYATDPHWRDLILFYEYFHGDTGRGCGASHQTGWTALATESLAACARRSAHTQRDTKEGRP
ncbi:MAG: glucosidase [Pirellulaceae bacterium]